MTDTHFQFEGRSRPRALSAYLLGTLTIEDVLSLQRQLIYEVGGDRGSAAVLLCDHPPGVTFGREGSRAHIRPNLDALASALRSEATGAASQAEAPVQWVSRGGGVMLHLPGQVACYPIVPLELIGVSAAGYVQELQNLAVDLLKHYQLEGEIDRERPGVRVRSRRIVHVGAAFREVISCFGLIVNVNPELELFHEVQCDGDRLPMTSLQRESSVRVRITGVRQQLLDLIASRFGFDRVSIFHHHPSKPSRSLRYVVAPSS